MGLLDNLLGGQGSGGGQAGGQGAGGSPLAGLLMTALSSGMGGGQAGMGGGMGGGMLGNLLGGGAAAGGIGALVNLFAQRGMGDIAQSWVSNGPNQPVSPDQLHQVLGADQVNAMAQQTGMQPHDLLSQLAANLPNLVNQATPNGTLPASEGGQSASEGGMFDDART